MDDEVVTPCPDWCRMKNGRGHPYEASTSELVFKTTDAGDELLVPVGSSIRYHESDGPAFEPSLGDEVALCLVQEEVLVGGVPHRSPVYISLASNLAFLDRAQAQNLGSFLRTQIDLLDAVTDYASR